MKKISTNYPEFLPVDRKVNVYEKTDVSFKSKAEKWGVNKRTNKETKLVLFSGTGRSGSKTYARKMQSIGLDVQHETNGEHGTSTHFFHTDHNWYPMFPWYKGRAHVGERLSYYEYRYKIHVVRNPLTAIPSIAAIFGSIDFEFLMDLGMLPETYIKDRILRCAHTYYAINKKLDEQNYDLRIRLEDENESWTKVCRLMEIDNTECVPIHVNKGTGYRKSEPINLEDIKDVTLSKNIKKMARRYGYEV